MLPCHRLSKSFLFAVNKKAKTFRFQNYHLFKVRVFVGKSIALCNAVSEPKLKRKTKLFSTKT